MFSDLNYTAATPEIFLAIASMVLLILGVFQGDKSTRLIGWLAAIALASNSRPSAACAVGSPAVAATAAQTTAVAADATKRRKLAVRCSTMAPSAGYPVS